MSVTACHSLEYISLNIKYDEQPIDILLVSFKHTLNEDTELHTVIDVLVCVEKMLPSLSNQLEKYSPKGHMIAAMIDRIAQMYAGAV